MQVHKHAQCSRELSATTSDSRSSWQLCVVQRQCLELWQQLCLSPTSIHPRMGFVTGQITILTAKASQAPGQPTAFLWPMETLNFMACYPCRLHISALSSSPPKLALNDPPVMGWTSSLREHFHRNQNTAKIQEQIERIESFSMFVNFGTICTIPISTALVF